MPMQPAICVNCGGQIEVDDVDLNGYGECPFCHTRYKIIDVITIDGLPTVISLLATAVHSMEDGNYEKAVKEFNRVLEIKPDCHEAWWGLYMCNSYFDRYYNYKDKYGNSGPLTKAQIMATTFQKYAARAIEYAPKNIAAKYQSETDETLSFIEAAKRGDFDVKTKGKSGCYVATTIYGSYDCDEVIKLRRFRDEHLAKSVLGRCFIRLYYKLSPAFSRYIHTKSKLGIKIRGFLDGVVSRMF